MVQIGNDAIDTKLRVQTEGDVRDAVVVRYPFFDPD